MERNTTKRFDDRGVTRRSLLLAAAGGVGLLATRAEALPAVQRPIAEFLAAQGSTNVFVPPSGDYVGWFSALADPPVRASSVDYAGVANRYLRSQGIDLGTTASGSWTERPLGGGRSEFKVLVHTKNALTWAIPLDGTETNPFGDNTLLFGWRAHDLVADRSRRPGLGGSQLQVVYRHNTGAAAPDLTRDLFVTPDPDLELVAIYIHASATGPLHARAGLGPDGTPGRCTTSQTGTLFRTPFNGANADGFPAERVELRAIGR